MHFGKIMNHEMKVSLWDISPKVDSRNFKIATLSPTENKIGYEMDYF